MDQRHSVPRFPSHLGAFDSSSTPLLRTDVLVIGGGVAGCAAALEAADQGAHVLVLAKETLEETNTAYAQGGIAAVLTPEDSVELHVQDTLRVGAGIADLRAVETIVPRSRELLEWLVGLGARFDRKDTDYALSREGGHSVRRVVHANGDATGAEIQRALYSAIDSHPRVLCRTAAFVRDLLVHDGGCVGANAIVDGMDLAVEAGATVMATGGGGQVYRETTNPIGATGDGIALCFRAGARMADMEFVQFHPTTLYIAGAARFLISEVVRGAGATLRDRDGERFMEGVHPMAELAPRDVVSRAILERMVATGDTHVYLDLSTVSGDPRELFPSIARICGAFDIDITVDPIPVRPGAHYFLGGVVTDLEGRTSLPGLFAAGETAATHLHGANRLASNSLLEGGVMGRIAGRRAAESRDDKPSLPRRVAGMTLPENAPRILHDDLLYSLKNLTWRQVGLLREPEGLQEARMRIGFWNHYLMRAPLRDRRTCELANMLAVSALVTEAALLRKESRGTHFRRDFPERDDESWCRHVLLERSPDGAISTELGPVFAPTDKVTA